MVIYEWVEFFFLVIIVEWLRGKMIDWLEYELFVFFCDGIEFDVMLLFFFFDCVLFMMFFKYGVVGWVLMFELIVQVWVKLVSGDLICCFKICYLINGLMEEDGEIWDFWGKLVVLSRQLVKYCGGVLQFGCWIQVVNGC